MADILFALQLAIAFLKLQKFRNLLELFQCHLVIHFWLVTYMQLNH